MPLTEDAKKELREAIRIVREDRFEAYVRQQHAKPPATDPESKLEKDGPNPPPEKTVEKEEVKEPNKSAYWGELLND